MVRDGRLKDILLLEAVPSNIYVECQGKYECLIPSNTTIPTRKTVLFDINAGDAGGPLFIRQGNSPNMRDNQIIGAMLLDGLCGARGSGHVSVDVCIDIGLDYGCTISVNGKTVLSS